MKDDGAFLMFDGQRGFGRRVAGEAMARRDGRAARETGVAVVTLANSHHVGRVGAYGELATAAGLVSLHFVNVVDHVGLVAPFRGSDARFSTNPVCIGMPGTATQPPAPARHGHQRRGDGQGARSRSGRARSCPTAT